MPSEKDEVPLAGGWVTDGVVRVGETVRRPVSRNASRVHALLGYLEDVGFEDAPRFLGLDEEGRETLTFVDGEVPSDCGSIVWRDEQLEAAAMLLRRYHDATAGSGLVADAEVVCHNDFGPWNLVWRDALPVAIIDFDNAAPGTRLDDLGYAIWKHLNLGRVELAVGEQRRRLRVVTNAYGRPLDEDVLDAIDVAQQRMHGLILTAPNDVGRDRDSSQLDAERAWLEANRPFLL